MNIGIILGRIGGIDGVALETEKWIQVLEKMGHSCHILTGVKEAPLPNTTIVQELDFHHPLTIREQNNAFYRQNVNEDKFIARLEKETASLETKILSWIVKAKIEILISENATALPCHLAMGWAIKNILEKTGIPCISHDHDFFWERGDRYKTRYRHVRKIMRDCFPVNLPNVVHAVINTYNKKELHKSKGIQSTLVPNVMDFDTPYANKDTYNRHILKDLSKIHPVHKNDILLFQVTRITRRKGIETAIQLVDELDDPRVKLVVTGTAVDDHNAIYFCELLDQVEDLKLQNEVLFAQDHFAAIRKFRPKGRRKYSIPDAYAYATACTYFSTYEGFGNAFVEAILAKRPIFVNNYRPVYWEDIGSHGFETVMLQNNRLTPAAVSQVEDIIYKPKRAAEVAQHNWKLGKKLFSYQVLRKHLEALIKQAQQV